MLSIAGSYQGLESLIGKKMTREQIESHYVGAILYDDGLKSDAARYENVRGAEKAKSLYNAVKHSDIGSMIRSVVGHGDDDVDGFAYLDWSSDAMSDYFEANGKKHVAINSKLEFRFGNMIDKINSADDIANDQHDTYQNSVREMAQQYVRALGVEGTEALDTLRTVYRKLKRKARKQGNEGKEKVYEELEAEAEKQYKREVEKK